MRKEGLEIADVLIGKRLHAPPGRVAKDALRLFGGIGQIDVTGLFLHEAAVDLDKDRRLLHAQDLGLQGDLVLHEDPKKPAVAEVPGVKTPPAAFRRRPPGSSGGSNRHDALPFDGTTLDGGHFAAGDDRRAVGDHAAIAVKMLADPMRRKIERRGRGGEDRVPDEHVGHVGIGRGKDDWTAIRQIDRRDDQVAFDVPKGCLSQDLVKKIRERFRTETCGNEARPSIQEPPARKDAGTVFFHQAHELGGLFPCGKARRKDRPGRSARDAVEGLRDLSRVPPIPAQAIHVHKGHGGMEGHEAAAMQRQDIHEVVGIR